MSYAKIDERAEAFFQDPTADKLLALQPAAFVSAAYDPSANSVLRLEGTLPTHSPSDLLQQLYEHAWIWQLCPRFHYVQARIHELLGEVQLMDDAVLRMQDCLAALLETGEGTSHSPLRITFQTDEADIFRVLGEQIRTRHIVDRRERIFEVVTSHSGQDVWFDVTPMFECRSEINQQSAAGTSVPS